MLRLNLDTVSPDPISMAYIIDAWPRCNLSSPNRHHQLDIEIWNAYDV